MYALSFGLLTGGGSLLGTGGGFVAAALYRRLDVAAKNAKSALATAKEAKLIAESLLSEAKKYADEQLGKIARGSKVELSFDQDTVERLAKLETRMSAVEDDLDARDKEDQRWQSEMQRSLGRIEGQLTR